MTISDMAVRRILELWIQGLTAEETQKTMMEAGAHVSLNTIYKYRKSDKAKQFAQEHFRQQRIDAQELLRQQTKEIEAIQDARKRLMYRDMLLNKLLPRQK